MADREKVINHFQDTIEASGNNNKWRFVRVDVIEDAIELLKDDETQLIYRDEIIKAHEDEIERLNELLKEQEPIKPTISVDTWICSKCGHTLESQELIDDKENPQVLIHEQYQYCPNCGREVKWNEA